MTLDIKPGKFYSTRSGMKVRIYATDGRPNFEVHGAILLRQGWEGMSWQLNGKYAASDYEYTQDIVSEWKEHPLELWVNIYSPTETVDAYWSKEAADKDSGTDLVRCVHMREVES